MEGCDLCESYGETSYVFPQDIIDVSDHGIICEDNKKVVS